MVKPEEIVWDLPGSNNNREETMIKPRLRGLRGRRLSPEPGSWRSQPDRDTTSLGLILIPLSAFLLMPPTSQIQREVTRQKRSRDEPPRIWMRRKGEK